MTRGLSLRGVRARTGSPRPAAAGRTEMRVRPAVVKPQAHAVLREAFALPSSASSVLRGEPTIPHSRRGNRALPRLTVWLLSARPQAAGCGHIMDSAGTHHRE